MGLHGPASRLKGIFFALRVFRRRILMASPVIQNLGNMADFFRLLRAAEDKIIILGSVVLRPEKAGLFRQSPLYAEQMADIVHRTEKVQVKVRLHVRLEKLMTIHAHLIFIRIQDIRLRLPVNGRREFIQGIGRQHIIMIRKYKIIPRSQPKGRVGVLGNLKRLFMAYHPDSGVLLLIAFQNGTQG